MTDQELPGRARPSRFWRGVRRLVVALLLGYSLFLAYAIMNFPHDDTEAFVEFLLNKASKAPGQAKPSASPAGTPGGSSRETRPSPRDEVRSDRDSAQGPAEQKSGRPTPEERPR